MRRLFDSLAGFDGLPQDIAWVLVDRLFRDTAALIAGALGVMAFGTVGYVRSGSMWYLAEVAYSVLVLIWRMRQRAAFMRAGRTGSPGDWGLQCLYSAVAAAAGWGATALVIWYDPDNSMKMLMIGMHSAMVIGGALRHATAHPVVVSQITVASLPLFVTCILSGSPALQVCSGMVFLQIAAGLSFSKALRQQTIDMLLRARETSDIADRLAIANQELAAVNRHLEMMAGTDALTEVANRRAFDLALAREWRRAQREVGPISLLLLDIDHFKAFNDFYGHQAGDACLRDVAATISTVAKRPGDVVTRYGGEEFAVVLPATSLEGAEHIAGGIIAALAARGLPHDASAFGAVTLSIGVACACPGPDDAPETLIARTDAALYAAKRSGRNRIHVADPTSIMPAGDVVLTSSRDQG